MPVGHGAELLVQYHRVDKISHLSCICEKVDAKILRSWTVDDTLQVSNMYPYTGETFESAFSTSVIADLRYDPLGKSYSRGGEMIWTSIQPRTQRDLLRLESWEVPLSNVCFGKRLAHTLKGLIGVVTAAAAVGDIITIVSHGSVPLNLRHVSDSHYRLIGESYIHGIMDGKAGARYGVGSHCSAVMLSGLRVLRPDMGRTRT